MDLIYFYEPQLNVKFTSILRDVEVSYLNTIPLMYYLNNTFRIIYNIFAFVITRRAKSCWQTNVAETRARSLLTENAFNIPRDSCQGIVICDIRYIVIALYCQKHTTTYYLLLCDWLWHTDLHGCSTNNWYFDTIFSTKIFFSHYTFLFFSVLLAASFIWILHFLDIFIIFQYFDFFNFMLLLGLFYVFLGMCLMQTNVLTIDFVLMAIVKIES